MKKNYMLFFLLPILCGCSYINSRLSTNPPTQQEQACSEIKRNIIFKPTSGQSVDVISATQQAEMMRLYDKKSCDKVLNVVPSD